MLIFSPIHRLFIRSQSDELCVAAAAGGGESDTKASKKPSHWVRGHDGVLFNFYERGDLSCRELLALSRAYLPPPHHSSVGGV